MFEGQSDSGYVNNPRSTSSKETVARPRWTDDGGGTGLVGIANQGATCYLNSLIQTLLFTPELRGKGSNRSDSSVSYSRIQKPFKRFRPK